MIDIGIVGGGITGLLSAYGFAREGIPVTVYEKEPVLGGLTGSFQIQGTYLEKYYHHLFSGHREIVELIETLGLGGNLVWRKTRMGFFYGNRVYPFSSAWDLIRFAPLNIMDRFRLGLTLLYFSRLKDWKSLDHLTAMQCLARVCGEEVCRVVWAPLLKMKFGKGYDQVSATWIWDRVKVRSQSRTQGKGSEFFGYLEGGFHKLFEALHREIERHGGEVRCNAEVQEILMKGDTVAGLRMNGRDDEKTHVILTLPTPEVARMVPQLPHDYLQRLEGIPHQNSLCIILRLKTSLSDYYWINVSDQDIPFVGIIEHTNFIPSFHYNGEHIVYLTSYYADEGGLYALSPEEIFLEYFRNLKKVFPGLTEDAVIDYHVFRDVNSQPVFIKNYVSKKPAYETPCRNLYLLNTSQVYPDSRCLNSSLKLAREICEILTKEK